MSERGANATILSANLAERSGLEPQPISQSTRLAGGACPMTVYFPWRRRMDSNPHRRGFAIRRIAILPRRLKNWWIVGALASPNQRGSQILEISPICAALLFKLSQPEFGGPPRTRTENQAIMSRTLYQLS